MKTVFSSLQWLFFILAQAIITPIAIGHSFHMSPQEIAELLQRTFLVIGVSGLLQTLFGHRLPISEGPAGLWWGVFIIYAGLVASGSLSTARGLQELEMGMLICGALFILLGLLKWMEPVKKLFTPLVTGTYLLLLVSQLSGSFVKGIAGIGYSSGHFNGKVAACACIVVIISIFFSKSNVKFLNSYSLLLSLLIGWALFGLLGLTKHDSYSGQWISVPKWFAWGLPQFSSGILVTSIFIGLLLLANMVATINVVEKTYKNAKVSTTPIPFNRVTVMMGINTWIAGIFSAVACVPISATAGFILTTKIYQRLPFLIGSMIMLVVSFFPALTHFFANLPAPVGYATMFLPFSSLIAIAFNEYRLLNFTENTSLIISISLMIGIGSLFIPASALTGLPSLLTTILNNGLVLGMIVCMILERVLKNKEAAPLRRDH
ncbi:purine/pyrimidine permease [Fictibacillus gelatini]|uniref:purine/pyrimidine permease n=1 Tax=Fictibacillus gelatini TaxID=225985 RepID=UPI00042904D4|nr:purine/pyrimidine permease [Fictibacillus gelatini]